MHNATSAPSTSYYDYIIVGGGTSGCPLAATLSKNARVLLLERGGSPYGNDNITYLSSFGRALSDLSPTSPAQRFISEDGVINARGRVLGGGSCLNAGVLHPGRHELRGGRRVEWPAGERVVRVGGEGRGIPAGGVGVAVRGEGRAGGSRGVAGQWVHL